MGGCSVAELLQESIDSPAGLEDRESDLDAFAAFENDLHVARQKLAAVEG